MRKGWFQTGFRPQMSQLVTNPEPLESMEVQTILLNPMKTRGLHKNMHSMNFKKINDRTPASEFQEISAK